MKMSGDARRSDGLRIIGMSAALCREPAASRVRVAYRRDRTRLGQGTTVSVTVVVARDSQLTDSIYRGSEQDFYVFR